MNSIAQRVFAPMWVRVGGGMELVPGADRCGPADLNLPPPGNLTTPLRVEGRLVGWAEHDDPGLAQQAGELGLQLARERRSHLVGRLDHKLRSALLSLQEAARAAAFGRGEMLETVYDLAQEVGRRAAGLSAAATDPKDSARGVVLAAALRIVARGAILDVPADAVVLACEPVLIEALSRTYEWMGGEGCLFTAQVMPGWVKMTVTPGPGRGPLSVPELGEPLVRFLVDTHLEGWVDVHSQESIAIFLPVFDMA